jgi:hypothetical protein
MFKNLKIKLQKIKCSSLARPCFKILKKEHLNYSTNEEQEKEELSSHELLPHTLHFVIASLPRIFHEFEAFPKKFFSIRFLTFEQIVSVHPD